MKPNGFELAIAVILVIGLVGGVAFVAPAGAADNPGLLIFEPEEVDAEPGDTFTVDVLFRASGDGADDGVTAFNYTTAYEPDVLTATDVEVGPWMEQGERTNVTTNTSIDAVNGSVVVSQARDPPGGGVNDDGEETVAATITFEVPEDAPSANAVIGTTAARAQLTEYPLPVLTTRTVDVTIDGGGEAYVPEGLAEEDDDPGVTLADDVEDDDDDDDRLPLLGLVGAATAAGLVGILLVRWRRH